MTVEDVVAVSWITVISWQNQPGLPSNPSRSRRGTSLGGCRLANALSAADAAAISACIDGTCELMIDRRRKQQIWTVVVDRIGYGFAHGDKPGPRIVTANEVITAAVEVDTGCTVDSAGAFGRYRCRSRSRGSHPD